MTGGSITMKRALYLLCFAMTASSACYIYDEPPDVIDTSGELVTFAEYVQPVLQVSCASLDCHGNAGRPMRLYAKNGLRMDVALRGKEASDAEMRANMEAIDGLDPADTVIENRLFLLKPLSVDAGGVSHIGGNLWLDQNNGTYRCLHAWLRAGVSDDAGRAICNQVRP